MKYSLLLLAFSFCINSINAQEQRLIVNSTIKLPTDSLDAKLLISSLNGFLIAAQQVNEENQFVLPSEKIETFVLLDEINGIEKSGRFKDDFFYKPYLTNVVSLDKDKVLIQVSYIGVNGNVPLLRASFEFIAHKDANGFLFASPLLRNTANWQKTAVANCIFHYKSTINKTQTKAYAELAAKLDKKLNSINKITEFYCCETLVDVLKLIGVEYKSDYNGMAFNVLGSVVGDKKLMLMGNDNVNFDEFDPHDLWHDRVSLIKSRELLNKPIDEGCAYLYGGSWGISWQDIFKLFKEKVAYDKKTDWAALKEDPLNFGGSDEKHLYADYVVNALIAQKLEKEKGFGAVWEFLNCGKYVKGNENYYKALEKLTGVPKSKYNDFVWGLISKEP